MRRILIALLCMMGAHCASAQCTFENKAFVAGETLNYKLYFNWQFVWINVGTASLKTIGTSYHGTPAYRSYLVTRGNQKADKYFVMRDTLLCYMTKGLAPLYYRKGALEGKSYSVDEVYYTYSGGGVQTKQHRLKKKEGVLRRNNWYKNKSEECVYDMLSIFMRARSFDASSWKKGAKVKFPIVDGDDIDPAYIVYKGKSNVKAKNGVTYRCLILSYSEWEDGKYKEIAKFFVTDDDNHVPIRLDMNLKFGSAKAYLTTMSGLKGAVKAIVK